MNTNAQAPQPDGRSTRWARHREQRRSELLAVARTEIHRQGPSLTMEDIAVASGTSKSIVYRYFKDKAELQRALGVQILNEMVQQLTRVLRATNDEHPSAETSIRAMTTSFVHTAATSRNLYEFVVQPSAGLNHFLTSVGRLVAASLPQSIDAQARTLWASGAVSFVQGVTSQWIRAREGDALFEKTPDDIADHLVTWLLAGPPTE
ncbi:TetR family transcriptional regulator [Helcobacillus massiliensis]|uniref:AcrR family transcriptional regulator n=1 Tax=Helcobacillus massiliensis TaxID=521392 RepID=A0A839QT55_9MICO|nr:AcrR family transcriptional regulator [Helcobacillus massiliensis]